MQLLRIGNLALVAAVCAALAWGLAAVTYGSLPGVPVFAGAPLLVLAVIEAVAGRSIRKRIADGNVGPGPHRLSPLTVARAAVLGKASAIVGAVMAGGWLGMLIHLLPRAGRLVAARDDVPGTVFGIVAAALLTTAAVWMERGCQAPPDSFGTESERDGD